MDKHTPAVCVENFTLLADKENTDMNPKNKSLVLSLTQKSLFSKQPPVRAIKTPDN